MIHCDGFQDERVGGCASGVARERRCQWENDERPEDRGREIGTSANDPEGLAGSSSTLHSISLGAGRRYDLIVTDHLALQRHHRWQSPLFHLREGLEEQHVWWRLQKCHFRVIR